MKAMCRKRMWTGTLVLLVAVALGLSACAEPVGYAAPYGWVDDGSGYWGGHGWGHWDHGHGWDGHHGGWGHGFAHGHGGFGGHAGGGFGGGHGGGGGHGR